MIYLFLIVGIGLIILSGMSVVTVIKKLKKNITDYGTVTGYKKNYIPKSTPSINNSYFPVIEFQYNGNKYKFVSQSGLFRKKYKIGGDIKILFDPEDPDKDPMVKTFWNLWMGCFVLLFLGSLFSWSSIAFLLGWKNIISKN
jgi:hypothetical protein